jgi:16S rRNA (uracil1498-N3)-methyltransferase
MRRFFIDGIIENEITLTGDDARHIGCVLRGKTGDEIIVADKDGKTAKMELTGFTKDSVRAVFKEWLAVNTESPVAVTLVQCLPKGDKMDFIVQKAVELGAAAIFPVNSTNSVVKYDAKKRAARRQKWQKVADEAAKQCGRTIRAEVKEIAEFKKMLEKLPRSAVKLMCYEAADDLTLRRALKENEADEYVLLIGAEGGFTKEEAELCRAHGFFLTGLGDRILRAETAAIAALSMVLYEKGDLGGRD